MLAFADDMVFLLESQIQMKNKLKVFHKYFEINGMCVNINKTNIVIFQKRGHGHLKKLDAFMYDGQKIELTTKYTYLGITFSQSKNIQSCSKRA